MHCRYLVRCAAVAVVLAALAGSRAFAQYQSLAAPPAAPAAPGPSAQPPAPAPLPPPILPVTTLSPKNVKPTKTSILVLPSIDQSTLARVHELHEAIATHQIEYEFLTRDFKVAGPELAKVAASVSAIDLTSADGRTLDNLKAIAKQSHADWVVSAVITQFASQHPMTGDWTVKPTIHVEVYEAKRNGWILNAIYTGMKNSGGVAMGPLEMYDGAINETIPLTLAPLVAQYPQIVEVGNPGGSNDYMTGQSIFYLPDPKLEFDGFGMIGRPPTSPINVSTAPTNGPMPTPTPITGSTGK
ncbi:MAG: hypothetical protein ACLQVD_04070 [Capsulimonadaceae bacterium]